MYNILFLPNFFRNLPRSLATWFSVHTLKKLPPNQNKQEKKPKCSNIKAQARKMWMKIHISCFVFTTYSWAMGPEWFPLFFQILIANKYLGWSWILCLLPICWGFVWHNVYRSCTCWDSLYEIICTSVLLSQKDTFYLALSASCESYSLSLFFLYQLMSLEEWFDEDILFSAEWSKVSDSLPIFSSGSLC